MVDRQEKDIDRQIIRCKDTVANVILGTKTNVLIAYATGLELHDPNMSIPGGHGGQ